MMKEVVVNSVIIGSGHPLAIIAGPCVIESKLLVQETAGQLKEICRGLNLPLIFKSSYDKANRTSFKSFRGPGLERGLEILAEVKKDFGLPVLTDVHSPAEAQAAANVVDIIQVPAFLSRQTDLLQAAAATGKPVNVKKGQFMAPQDMSQVISKLEAGGCSQILLTERGASFGYHNLVVDMRSLFIMRELGYPVVFDATHSVQYPGGAGEASGGERRFVPLLSRAAVAVGVDALFLEVHPHPDQALCDGPNSLSLDELPLLLEMVKIIDLNLKRMLETGRRQNCPKNI